MRRPDHPHAKPSPKRPDQPLAAAALMTAGVLVMAVFGHDGRRIAQVVALALPVIAWLLSPVRSPTLHRARSAIVWLWAMAFALDGACRAYLRDAYQAAPDSAMVLGAIANANARESAEYLNMQWRSVAVWCAAVACAALVFGWASTRGSRTAAARRPRWGIALLCGGLLVSSIGYAIHPWRRLQPVLFWSNWHDSVEALRAGWADQEQNRARTLARARLAAPALTQAGPGTVVLVITDSVNRDNLSLYGYERPTTPGLIAQKAELRGQMLVLRNAWSVDASTLPALRNLFSFGVPDRETPQHLLALARAAGYKVWWLSNHDDVGIEQEHARLADVVEMVNRTPGRSGTSLDGELLDCVREAIEDTAARKLIVVHLMGAHPHYGLRFPEGDKPMFDGPDDTVEAGLRESGRSGWVRRSRREYDTALRYHDIVVSETLQLTRSAGQADEYRAWMYLSDHGQEVGHGSDRAGHSPSTASGYRIPALIWQNRSTGPIPEDAAVRPFRADWAAWTVADLLGLQWAHAPTDRNVLRDGYRWQAPTLPAPIRSFVDGAPSR